MDYFTDVYLKRVNKHGTDLQSRVHGKMECDFENKLAKSVNRVEMFDYTDKESFDELEKRYSNIAEHHEIIL